MSIKRVDNDLPASTKIKQLNDMILELNGKVQQGKFDKNEIDQIYDAIPSSRKFKREQGVGNTDSTYSNWSHLKAEDGYSIWKYTVSDYTYNSLNKLYMDGEALTLKEEALSESATTFDLVYLYDGALTTYTDDTTEAGTEGGTAFDVMNATNDYLYVGLSTKFNGIKFEWQTRGSNYGLKVEYYNGSTWVTMTANAHGLDDDTNSFGGNGSLSWDSTKVTTWAQNAVNSQTKYWIRISSTTLPVTVAKAYYIIPANNVVGLLALSSTQIQDEEWAWTSLGTAIYVTVRNAGNSNYEGSYYITSSSSASNKQNFFQYNEPFTMDYQWLSYTAVKEVIADYSVLNTDGIMLCYLDTTNITLTLPAAHGNDGVEFVIKKIDASAYTVTIATESGETIDGAGTKVLRVQHEFVRIISDNGNWRLIGGDNPVSGTWIPTIEFGGASVGITYTEHSGNYTKIGDTVTITGYITMANKGSSSGVATIEGFPFTLKSGNSSNAVLSMCLGTITFANQYISLLQDGTTSCRLREVTQAAGVITDLTEGNFADTSVLVFSGTYKI